MATEQQMKEYYAKRKNVIAEIFSHLNEKGNSASECPRCEGKRGVPEQGHVHCVVCMAEAIEQDRLEKQSWYKFFRALDFAGSIFILGIFVSLCYSWSKHWVPNFALSCIAMAVVWNLHSLICRRTRAEYSLDTFDRRNRNREF